MSVRIHRVAGTHGATIELRPGMKARPQISHVVFDFDGTLSWLRHGWPGMMGDALAYLAGESGHAIPAEERNVMLGEILALNGSPAIFQCRRLVERLGEQGGPSLTPEAVHAVFQECLEQAIQRRMQQIQSGASTAAAYIIHGALPFLELLSRRRLTLAILSTTAQERVIEEARLLGLSEYFGRHIYGGTGAPLLFSKRAVFERLLAEEQCPGAHLLSLGDGPVEIRETKALGGVAVGVCSDEFQNGSGLADPHKREGLFAAGADVIMPDYREGELLMDYLFDR